MSALSKTNTLYITLICILLFYSGFQLTSNSSPFLNYNTGVDLDGGNFVRFVFIGSSQCGFSNNEENHENIINLKKYLKQLVEENNYKFISTGISVDFNAYNGIKYLEKTGPFDEIASGSSWFNIGADRYVWENFQGAPSTPQIIITKSNYTVEENFGIQRSEEILKRVRGKDDIREMLKNISQLNHTEVREWLEM